MKLRIRSLRQKAGLTLEQLAEKAGISRSYLNELELGAKTINAHRLEQVARALNVTTTDLIEPEIMLVPIAGKVGAGSRVPLDDATEDGGLYRVRRPSQLAGMNVSAVEVVGDSMAPMYQPGHILFFSRNTDTGIPTEDLGMPCVVADEKGMAWVKQVTRGSEPGLFHLISLNRNAESVWDQRIIWAARVLLALPSELAGKE